MVNVSDDVFKTVLTQLIRSDGMKVTNDYLIQQKIYYIDNVALIEELERTLMEYYYNELNNGSVDKNELLNRFTPQYINYDKYFMELNRKYNSDTVVNNDKNSLDGYF